MKQQTATRFNPLTPRGLVTMAGTAALALVMPGCGGSSGSTTNSGSEQPGSESRQLTIPFSAVSGATALACDAVLTGLGTSGSDARLAAFGFYVHDVTLLTADGSEVAVTLAENDWQANGVALVDFQDKLDFCAGDAKPTNTVVVGQVDHVAGTDYRGIRFTLGVPTALNHQDATSATAPLNNTAMFWNWQGGYKFARFDVEPVGGVARPDDAAFTSARWNFHLGSTNCTPDPRETDSGAAVSCEQPNRPTVELDGFTPGFDGGTVSGIRIDYAALVATSNLGLDQSGPAGCMSGLSDPECAALFARLGMAFNDNAADQPQSVFSVTNP